MWKMYVLCIWEQIYCTHEHITGLWERGNIEVGTHDCLLLTWECLHVNVWMTTWEQPYNSVGTSGNVGTTYGNDSVGWQANMIVENRGNYTIFHVGMLNMHRVHLFLVLHIEKFAILTWKCNMQHFTLDRSTNPQKIKPSIKVVMGTLCRQYW